MENIIEEEKTSSTNRSISRGQNNSIKKIKKKYFLIKKCERNNSKFLGKKTLIRKKIRKISSNLINNKSNINKNNNNNIILNENIKKKLIIIHFNNIKNLCEYIIINFNILFNNKVKDEKNKDLLIFQLWKCLNILSKKIYLIQKEKLFKSEKKEIENLFKIKDILLNIKKNFSDKMAKNLRHILANIDHFCSKYSK